MKSVAEFVNENGITLHYERAPRNPCVPEWTDANHYSVTLKHGRRIFSTPFSQGYGVKHTPEVADVLDCIASDCAGYENASDALDFAAEYAYDDLKKARRVYQNIERQARRLRTFLGDELYEELLWETERM